MEKHKKFTEQPQKNQEKQHSFYGFFGRRIFNEVFVTKPQNKNNDNKLYKETEPGKSGNSEKIL